MLKKVYKKFAQVYVAVGGRTGHKPMNTSLGTGPVRWYGLKAMPAPPLPPIHVKSKPPCN